MIVHDENLPRYGNKKGSGYIVAMADSENDLQIQGMQRGRRAAGACAAALIEPNMVVGLGTGDTAAAFIRALGERVKDGGLLGLRCVATSKRSAELGRSLGLFVVDLDELPPGDRPIDITVDGADEIDPELQLIKGAGGALLFEKLVAHASKELIIVADPGKRVRRLGEKRLLPVEIVGFGIHHTLHALRRISAVATAELRTTHDGLYLTDGGNRIVDIKVQEGADAAALHGELKALCGVVETGLFLREATRAFIGDTEGRIEVQQRRLT